MSTLVAGIDSSTQSCKVVIREAGSGALAREDAKGTFGARIAARRPDVVIDLICFTAASARQLVDARRGELKSPPACSYPATPGPSGRLGNVNA